MTKDSILYEKAVCPHCDSDVHIRYQTKPNFLILGLVDTDGVVTNTKSQLDIYVIYDFWNDQQIIVHRKMNSDLASTIKASLHDYSDTEILQSIKNYAEIQKDKQYWFNYAWTLKDFLKRGISKFLDLEIAKGNYLIKESTAKGNRSYKMCHICGYKELTAKTHCPTCTNPLEKDFTAGKYGHMVQS